MRSRNIKIITISAMLALSIGASFSLAFASWQFNKADAPETISALGITSNWTFGSPIEPGSTITIDSDGTISIDGTPILDATVTYPDGSEPDPGGGTISYDIGVVDGELVVTNYEATDLNKNGGWFSSSDSTIAFPDHITINGTDYPVVAVSQPVSINLTNHITGSDTVKVVVPEGYRSICDNAFQDISADNTGFFYGSVPVTYELPTSLEYLGHHAFKLDVSKVDTTITYAGTKAQFKALINASASEYGSGYTFFTASDNNRCTVTCSDGNIVYNQNGTVYSE